MTVSIQRPYVGNRSQSLSFRVIRAGLVGFGVLIVVLLLLILHVVTQQPRSGRIMRLVTQISLPPAASFLAATDYAAVLDHSLFVSYSSADTLLTIDTATNTVSTFATHLEGIHGVAFAADSTHLFASLGSANRVAVVKLADASSRQFVPTGLEPDGIVFDRKADVVYVGNGKSNSATMIPAEDLDHPFAIKLGGSPEFPQVDETTGLIYQPLEDTSEVVVLSPMERKVVSRFPVSPCEGPKGTAIDQEHRLLFIGCSNRLLAVMNLQDGHIIATSPIGRFVDYVAFDPGLRRVYTANSAGTMTIIEQIGEGRYMVLENIRTKAGGHTLAIDPRTHRVYVICAGIIRGASVVVFEPANLGASVTDPHR